MIYHRLMPALCLSWLAFAAAALLETVIERTAALVAHWMAVGFIHGVMNTDNTAISGETLDYGPFGFLDEFDPETCYSSIDRRGRYAWKNQPTIAHWNLTRLAECLLPLIDDREARAIELANAALLRFPEACQAQFAERMTAKIGVQGGATEDLQLGEELLKAMHAGSADYTLAFRRLSSLGNEPSSDDHAFRQLFRDPAGVDPWLADWRKRLATVGCAETERQAKMRAVNPAYILRNHLAQRAADAAVQRLDFGPFKHLLGVLSRPYDDQPEHADLARPPRPEERVIETFCCT